MYGPGGLLISCGLLLFSVGVAAHVAGLASLLDEASSPGFVTELLRWRRELHAIPELSFQENETSAYVRAQLDQLGIPYEFPFGGTGIRAVIGAAAASAPAIALRADMDGLPVHEEEDVPYRSTAPGRMHACGHDGHMAMLLGAASLLKAREASLPGGGPVVLLFQPAEEGQGGARTMVAGGALRGVGAVHGVHVWPDLPAGTVGTRPGTMMAASDRFTLLVRGAGGHGALPHTTRDPVVAASAVVLALQALVSRETAPVDSAVVTVARFNTGPGAPNVIPDQVELIGTVRALTAATFQRLHVRLEQVAAGVAAAYGCSVDKVTWSAVPYPPTRNEPRMHELVLRTASSLLEAGRQHTAGAAGKAAAAAPAAVEVIEPSLAAEDFSFYGDAVPQTAFTFLGTGDAALGTDVGLHSPRFRLDERQLPVGAALHAAIALEWLSEREAKSGGGGVGPPGGAGEREEEASAVGGAVAGGQHEEL